MKTDYSYIFDDPAPYQKRPTDLCDYENCQERGTFRAPKNRMGDFYWFCLDHVRLYNASWNYYQDVPDTELESYIRYDTTWQRPSWPLHARTAHTKIYNTFDFDVCRDNRFHTKDKKYRKYKIMNTPQKLQESLDLLELNYPFTKHQLKKNFRALVKKFHPDANENDPLCVEMIKKVNEAYALLKKHIF